MQKTKIKTFACELRKAAKADDIGGPSPRVPDILAQLRKMEARIGLDLKNGLKGPRFEDEIRGENY